MSNQIEKTKNDLLVEKYADILDDTRCDPIEGHDKRVFTAQLLENSVIDTGEQVKSGTISEDANVAHSNLGTYNPMVLGLIRRSAPRLLAYDTYGTIAIDKPDTAIFAMRARYDDKVGKEALHKEIDTAHSGTGTHGTGSPWGATAPTTGTGKSIADGENDAWAKMSATFEKVSVQTKTRQLRANLSIEVQSDMKAIYGMDALGEMSSILATELTAEINQECIRNLYNKAIVGAQGKTTAGTFDLSSADTTGRHFKEHIDGLYFHIMKEANQIALDTRRGVGNFIITTANVASALATIGKLAYQPVLEKGNKLDNTPAGVTYAGTLNGIKVYVDPYTVEDGALIGYKGSSQLDAGEYFLPYILGSQHRATDPETFQPAIGLKSRYAIASNPFTVNDDQGVAIPNSPYYRKFAITGL